MRRKCKKSRGFTLVELLVSLVLSAILLTGFGVALHGTLFSYERNSNSTALDHVGRSIVERMTQEIRSASNVDCGSNLLRIYPADTSGPSEIRYRLADGVFYYDQVNGGAVTSNVLVGANDSVTVQSF
ncbi:MAG: prepilin-type N-terminal cleavage/methylation domain-containing protein, partial [Phycisphaerae bacterium]|nr:prepilin-type N-terminal cleavage/methylation domain-containing protein [Phycisphaerae bacterium]